MESLTSNISATPAALLNDDLSSQPLSQQQIESTFNWETDLKDSVSIEDVINSTTSVSSRQNSVPVTPSPIDEPPAKRQKFVTEEHFNAQMRKQEELFSQQHQQQQHIIQQQQTRLDRMEQLLQMLNDRVSSLPVQNELFSPLSSTITVNIPYTPRF